MGKALVLDMCDLGSFPKGPIWSLILTKSDPCNFGLGICPRVSPKLWFWGMAIQTTTTKEKYDFWTKERIHLVKYDVYPQRLLCHSEFFLRDP